MSKILKNYGSSLLLLAGVIIGGLCGIVFKEQTSVVKPIGDLFLNLMFCTIVPLIFFSISSAIAKTNEMSRLGSILKNTVIIFFATGTVAALFGYICVLIFNPLNGVDANTFTSLIGGGAQDHESLSIGEMIVNLFTVSDFKLLFDKGTLLPLIIFTIAFGVATASLKDKAKVMADFLVAGSEVILKMVGYVMKLAPIGLGCYFAYTVGQLGPQLLTGFLNTFILYLVMTVLYFFGFFSLFAFVAGGREGVKRFWKNAIDPSLAAIATSSSAACIPINLISAKKMGVPDDVVETVIPLGANLHKDGSVMGNVLKIVFILLLSGKSINTPMDFAIIIVLAIVSGLVVGGIPSGGATAEILILSVLGLNMNLLGLVMIISTLIDIPATLLNSTGNTVTAMMVARFTEGKDWLMKKVS